MATSETKLCPLCREEIKADAIRCKHCQAMLETEAGVRGGAGFGHVGWGQADGPRGGMPLGKGRMVGGGRFELRELVGMGGMGEVYLAEHTYTGQQVAVKAVWPNLMTSEATRKRFLLEGRILAALQHPGIVRLTDFFEEDGRFFLVMEFVKGQTIQSLLDKAGGRSLPFGEVRRILEGVLEALSHAHGQNPPVIHRDIKPSNVMLADDGRIVLMDFGIAKVAGGEKLTRTQGVVGTYEYMSPEQIQGLDIAPATDVYGTGILAFLLISGSVPFAQTTDSGFEAMEGHKYKQPPVLRNLRQDCPPGLERWVVRALAKSPAERFSSARTMLSELQIVWSSATESAEPAGSTQEHSTRPGRMSAGPPRVEQVPAVESPAVLPPCDSRQGNRDAESLSALESDIREVGKVQEGMFAAEEADFERPWHEVALEQRNRFMWKNLKAWVLKQWEASPALVGGAAAGLVAFALLLAIFASSGSEGEEKGPAAKEQASVGASYVPSGEADDHSGFAQLSPGCFTMGKSSSLNDMMSGEEEHEVCITRSVWFKKTEVTQREWLKLIGGNLGFFDKCGESCPIESVSWFDSLRYLNALSKSEGLEECYVLSECSGIPGAGCAGAASCTGDFACQRVTFVGLDCEGYRLPTEAEWEYVARAGDAAKEVDLNTVAWHTTNSGERIHPVGRLAANGWGLYDVLGNVWEWCWDAHDPVYTRISPRDDPQGPEPNGVRAIRGGAWSTSTLGVRATRRSGQEPQQRSRDVGFRPVRTIR